jgi:hypothetical protein
MSMTRSIAVIATAALLAVPSAAIAVGPPTDPGNGHRPAGTPAPPASPSTNHPTQTSNPGAAQAAANAKAYGRLCRVESRKHVKGEKGTAFSRCVTAMAKAASGEAKSARSACAGLSRKHKTGEHSTPFSRCVVAASRLLDRPQHPAGA